MDIEVTFINTNMSTTPPRPIRNDEFRTPRLSKKALFPKSPESNLWMKGQLIRKFEPTLNQDERFKNLKKTPEASKIGKKDATSETSDYPPGFGPED